MPIQRVVLNGRSVALGSQIGRGGEGNVYLLDGDPTTAIKIYTLRELGDRAQKVRAMISAGLANKEPLIAFPHGEVRDESGLFLGFAMRAVPGCKPVHEVFTPGSRKTHFPQADYRFLVRVASNLARAVACVHRCNCVIGDINQLGILVSSKAVVSLIDADSFQIRDQGTLLFCKVGFPDYTPPELQHRSLDSIERTTNHDAFGLAVIIFQLLFMGRHPFVGRPRSGETPPMPDRIARLQYPYTDKRDVGMDQPPGTPSIMEFYEPLANAFDQAFLTSGSRPTALDWLQVLDRLEADLIKCSYNNLHHIPRQAAECPWCELERQTGAAVFVPSLGAAAFAVGADFPEDQFNLDGIWAQIRSVYEAADLSIKPTYARAVALPSEQALVTRKGKLGFVWGWATVLIVVGFFLLNPGDKTRASMGVMMMLVGALLSIRRTRGDTSSFTAAYVAAQRKYLLEVQLWNRKVGLSGLAEAFAEAEQIRDELQRLTRQRDEDIRELTTQRRTVQLNAHLAGFVITKGTVERLSAAMVASLASYGVDTAADVDPQKLSGVPGIGQVTATRLFAWRNSLERRFVYQPNKSSADHQAIYRVKAEAHAKTSLLKAKLAVAPQHLSQLRARLASAGTVSTELIAQAALARDQAEADLQYLSLPLPQVTVPIPSITPSRTPAPSHITSVPPTTSVSAQPSCPRCNSAMTKRVAKRGLKAGNHFWGCTRYPTCKGTRTI
jgi:DNA-binding helix-hairpin-helix protein with protein kinase domain